MIDRLARKRMMLLKNLPPLKTIFEVSEGAHVLDPQNKLFSEILYDEKNTNLMCRKYDYTGFKLAIREWDAGDLQRFVDMCTEIEGQKDRRYRQAQIMRGHLEEELRLRASVRKAAPLRHDVFQK